MNPVIYAAVTALVLAGVAFAGYRLADANCEAAKAEAVQRSIEQFNAQAAQDAELAATSAQKAEQTREKTKIVIREVVRHVKDHPAPAACNFDTQRMCLLRASARNEDATQCSKPGLDASVSQAGDSGK